MTTVHVNLAERSYDIEIGCGNLSQAGAILTRGGRVSHAVLITDSNLEKLHATRVAAARPAK